MLSSRVLHFTQSELTWECMEGEHCECGDVSRKPAGFQEGKQEYLGNLDNIVKYGRGYSQLFWNSIVKQYSRLQLSFGKDRLPALAGLARQMQPYRNTRYLAGLWEDTFLSDLVWYTSNESNLGDPPFLGRPEVKYAPTWSWASVNRPVGFHALGDNRKAGVLEVECIAVGEDSFGAVASGRLRMSGPLISATLRFGKWNIHHEKQFWYIESENQVDLSVNADYDYSQEGDSKIRIGEMVYLLHIASDVSMSVSLVLRSFDGASQVYERIGTVFTEHLDVNLEAVRRLFDDVDDVVVTIS